jgi:hypothetical protein
VCLRRRWAGAKTLFVRLPTRYNLSHSLLHCQIEKLNTPI